MQYHEQNEMEDKYQRIKNYSVNVQEVEKEIIFLRKLERGGSEHSIGIHVDEMAGMPKSVVKRADSILHQLESNNRNNSSISKPLDEVGQHQGMQLSFFQLEDPVLLHIRDEIKQVDINNLTPMEALKKLNDIKTIITGK